ncbi:TPA: hypothetical protein OUW94_003374 [Escherichia coli]|nr:hypothetical protein [Escherichia coli]
MKNRKAKLLLLSRSTGYEKLPISNHKRAVIGMFGRVVFAFNYKPTASQNRRKIIVIQCDDGTVTVVNVRNDRVAVCRKGEPCKEIKL